MKKQIVEEWEFAITVKEGEVKHCRLGFETGDVFTCQYEVPSGFCPKTMATLHTLCEIVRCGGNYRLRGSENEYEIDFPCTDGCVCFHLVAKQINQ